MVPENKASIAVSMGLAFSFMASASQAAPPEVGSEQWNLLAPYSDFIRAMKTPDGKTGCCDMSDGRAELQERMVDGQYQVYVTQDLYPNAVMPDGGLWITIPPEDVLDSEDARRFCAPYLDKAGHSCQRPPFNVLWLDIYNLTSFCYIPRPSMY